MTAVLFINELGLSIPTEENSNTTATTTAKPQNNSTSAIGELIKQPELLSQPIHQLDWSVYYNILSNTGSLPKRQKL